MSVCVLCFKHVWVGVCCVLYGLSWFVYCAGVCFDCRLGYVVGGGVGVDIINACTGTDRVALALEANDEVVVVALLRLCCVVSDLVGGVAWR